MTDQVTIGMIGCGGMAEAHLSGYQALYGAGLRDFRIIGTCDLDRARAEAMADRLGAMQGHTPTVYADFEAMLAGEPGLDAVDINVEHRSHHRVAVPCLQAGKHVIIEKPLAITMRAGRAILQAAEASGKLLQVAENYRRSPEHRATNAALKSGRIGQPRMIFWLDAGERLNYWGWREHRSQAGAGWSLDGGVHFADLFRYHLGPVTELYGRVRAFNPYRYQDPEKMEGPIRVDVEDTTMALLQFESGAVGEWMSTGAAPGEWSRRVIYGEEGSIDTDSLKTRTTEVSLAELVVEYEASLSSEDREKLFPRGITDTVATELWEFAQAIRGEAAIETDGVEGYKALAICFALYESAALNAPVRIADVENLVHEAYQQDLNDSLGLT